LAIVTIDGYKLKKALIAGANELSKNKDYVDSLNVFPVPDGDTGVNMALTTIAAAKEVEKINTPNIYEVAKAASNGSLRGARGNSGVILSQLFRGFAKGLEGKEVADSLDIAEAFIKGAQTAYKAVMKPKEGTILTVAREFAEYSVKMSEDTEDISAMIRLSMEYAFKILDKTTEMLPELKQANVVDAGGRGLLYIIEGVLNSAHLDDVKLIDPSQSHTVKPDMMPIALSPADIKFAYCTEFFIDVEKTDDEMEDNLKAYLNNMGDSIVVVCDEDIIKVHVHTNNPGLVLERALTLGSLSNLKIENMRLQHTNLISFSKDSDSAPVENKAEAYRNMETKEAAFIAVAAGEGLAEMFKSLGADYVIEGGQSMNPSTDDILKAIESVNSDHVFVLPNNKNIILAADQAAELSNKTVYVVPSKSVPQGVSALVSYVPGFEVSDNLSAMSEAMKNVKTGTVTFAVRASNADGTAINDGDILGMQDGKINVVGKDIAEVSKAVIDKLFESESGEVLSIYYGEGVDYESANELKEYASVRYPGCDSVVMSGGQPLYYYIISLE
jgi:DAK2 domain fusion protein YloV